MNNNVFKICIEEHLLDIEVTVEPKIGQIIDYNVKLRDGSKDNIIAFCVEDNINNKRSCESCVFYKYNCNYIRCRDFDRADNKSVIFNKIENVEFKK